MTKLKVIPVIDILNGKVVHAVGGKRSQYKPIESVLCKSSDPTEVASAFKALGFTEVYVADLDAIIDCSMKFPEIVRIAKQTGLSLMVDAGVTNIERAEKLLQSGAIKLVIGTETLQSKSFIAQAIERFGNSQVVLSLDLKGNKVITKAEGVEGTDEPLQLLREFEIKGVNQVIVLDLERVGSAKGVNLDFLKKAMAVGVDIVVGGGVGGICDIVKLKNIGISGALVSTALHNGKITIKDLKRLSLI